MLELADRLAVKELLVVVTVWERGRCGCSRGGGGGSMLRGCPAPAGRPRAQRRGGGSGEGGRLTGGGKGSAAAPLCAAPAPRRERRDRGVQRLRTGSAAVWGVRAGPGLVGWGSPALGRAACGQTVQPAEAGRWLSPCTQHW